MKHFTNEEYRIALSSEAVVCMQRTVDTGPDPVPEKPLWLTASEAESLLVLCAASPVSAGPYEQSLFHKMSDYFRSHSK